MKNHTTEIKNSIKLKTIDQSDEVGKSIHAFLSGNTGKFGKYYAVENALVYRIIQTSNYGEEINTVQNIIAIKIVREGETIFLGNASILPAIGATVSFGNRSLNGTVTDVQERLALLISMVPFSVFTESNLNLMNINILDRGQEETITRTIENPNWNWSDDHRCKNNETTYDVPKQIDEIVHFTGSSLYEVDGEYFLFDIDREEVKHKIFNPFLVGLPKKVDTIKEAYDSLMPSEVKNSPSFERQGEWFFVPSSIDPTKLDVKVFGNEGNTEVNRHSHQTYTLRAGRNRPNYAQMGFTLGECTYVKGTIKHSGREHRDVFLKTWHKVVPNTATKSFTIEGDID